MARRRKGRTVNGIVLLDKPTGLTSNQSLQRVKRLFDAAKAGHTGSLDPSATGVLPLCFGHATKISGFLLDADKRYQVRARFGSKTTTADADGEVVASSDVRPTRAQIDDVLAGFHGPIEQIPPMYSALKQGGQRLYSLARKGIEVERPARLITIHELTMTRWDTDGCELDVACSKGTYIRTLVEDIAAAAGALAHVAELRRTQAGPFGPQGLVTLEQLEQMAAEGTPLDDCLLPIDSALQSWPQVVLERDSTAFLLNGQSVRVPGTPPAGWVRIYAADSRFLGMGEMTDDGRVAPRRLFH